jgi:predicted nuclease of restriction endonuclease-like (RecB) superfamily
MKPEKPNSHIQSLIDEIKILVSHSRQELGRTVNRQLLHTYWQIGKIIVERESTQNLSARKLVLDLSKELTRQLGKGFSRSNLFNMRLFHLKYPDVQTLSGHLSWSHVCELLSIEDDDARAFYETEMLSSKWSVRELKRQINSSLFERLLLSKGSINKKDVIRLSKEGQIIEKPEDIIKEPYVLEFLGIPENKPILEKDLEKRLIRYIEDFLLELGKGFMFVGSQQRVTIGNKHHYVDMVFYNKILRAYILIDLKMKKLLPAYVGQMNAYLNYYKTEINEDIDNDPIGIILCTAKDEIVAEYALGGLANQIFASKYVYYLPNKEELIGQVQKALNEYEDENE